MAIDNSSPFTDGLDAESRRSLFSEISYQNMNGVRRDVTFTGREERLEHGLNFTPTEKGLTVRIHLAYADVGSLWTPKAADETYVYVRTARPGRAIIEIAHPPMGEQSVSQTNKR